MAPSARGRGSGRGAGSKRVWAATIIQPPQDPKLNSWTLRDDHSDTLSDDSTQPPDRVLDTCFDNPIVVENPHVVPIVAENPHVVPNRNDNVVNVGSVHVPLVVPPKKRGRGPAKCTEFDKLRKHGKIPLKINDGDVPEAEKDELIDRVRVDFIFDWDLKNHQKTVWKQLRKRFNAFHHQLHKKSLEYATHEEALANRCSLVEPLVWVKLCGRWGSEAFKKVSMQNIENRKKLKTNHTTGRKSFVRILEEKGPGTENLVEFYKEVRWSKKKGEFVTSTT
ncbi:hypothetical protein F2P56_031260 [Juglans regia]|uniref:Uncharacterized protein n=1 Tax=Juglans regia TaxID=51240 RepID=A0A833TMI9_JUGRE|nr:hypothetical protein F2P56_031260 [Juglans regia]